MILAILGCLAFSRVVGAAFVPEDDRALADRLLMHWNTHAADVFVRDGAVVGVGGRDAGVPTVMFGGQRTHVTAYKRPKLEDLPRRVEDPRGLLLEAGDGGKTWAPYGKTGCIIVSVNREIMSKARDAARKWKADGDEFSARLAFNALGDTAVYNADPVFVTRDSRTGKTSALVYAYPSEYESHVPSMRDIGKMKEASPTSVELTLTGLPAGASVEIETLDFDHGDAYSAWEAMGRPHSPTRAETAALKSKAEATARELVRIGKDGTLVFNRRLQPWTLVLIREL